MSDNMRDRDKTKDQLIEELTEMRQQVAEFKASRQHAQETYKQMLDDMNDAYVVVQEGKYVFANRRFYEIFRYEPGEVIEKPIMQFIAPGAGHQVIRNLSASKRKKNFVERRESIAKTKSGRAFLCETVSKNIQYEGNPALCIVIRDITEHKRAEEALIRSERKYRELAESISDIFIAMDNKLRYTYWNKAAEKYTGILAKDALGKHPQQLFPDVVSINNSIKEHLEVINTREPRQFMGNVRLGGKVHVLEVSLYPSGDGISVFARDITRRRRMQEELRESRERFQALVESTSDWVWEINTRGIYTYASPRVSHLLGYEPEEVVGKTPFDFMPQENAEEMAERFRAIARDKKPFEALENVNLHKNGRLVVLETSGMPFFDAKGRLCGYRGIDRDITERKKAEDILRESEEKLRLTFESVMEGIIVCNLEGRIIDVNEGVVRMHGYGSKEDLIGEHCCSLMSKKDRSRLNADFEKTLKKGSAGITLYTFISKDMEEFLSATSTAVLRDSQGKPSGFVILTADVTEQQRRQEQLMLTDRLASIGQLTSGIAHELNNPLTSVIGFSEMLLDREFPEDVREDLETIDREARRAADVVKGLLTFVRKQRTEKVPVDINGIIREVLQLRSYEQIVNKIKVESRFAPDLPLVTGNGAQMQQVFVNLIVNAEQAMHETNGKGRLKITTERDEGIVRISIDDDGPGINPEDMKRLFTPFFTTKEVGKGTGLGLSICHGIITEHGGRIFTESEPGTGARFVVELPVPSVGRESKEDVRG